MSTDDQAERQTPIRSQVAEARKFCGKQGWAVVAELLDEGISGSTLDRPALSELRALCAAGSVDVVACWELSRLSRDTADSLALLREFASRGIQVASVTEPLDASTPFGKFATTVRAGVSELESAMIRDRSMRGKRLGASEGRWVQGRVPYGFVVGPDKHLVHHPEEAAVVRLAFELLSDPLTSQEAAAARLNELGYRTRAGYPWTQTGLRYVLRNPAVFGFARHACHSGYPPDKPHTYLVENAHEPILTLDAWQALGYSAHWYDDLRFTPRARLTARHPLSGLLRCVCGGGMSSGGRQGAWANYRCRLGGRPRGHSPSVAMERSERDVWRWVAAHVLSERAVRSLEARESREAAARLRASDSVRPRIEANLTRAQRRAHNLAEAVAEDGLSLALRRGLAEAEAQVASLEAELSALAAQPPTSAPIPRDELILTLHGLRERMPTLDGRAQNQILWSLLDRVDVDADGRLSPVVNVHALAYLRALAE